MVFLDTVIFAQKGHYLEGGNPLRKTDFKKTVSLRASTCSTRREYDRQGWRKCRFCRSIKPTVPVPKALASLMGWAPLMGQALRLKRPENLTQIGFPSLRSVKSDRLPAEKLLMTCAKVC